MLAGMHVIWCFSTFGHSCLEYWVPYCVAGAYYGVGISVVACLVFDDPLLLVW
jgi:hypothetical protein